MNKGNMFVKEIREYEEAEENKWKNKVVTGFVVAAFEKSEKGHGLTPNEYGPCDPKIRYILNPVNFSFLQKLFKVENSNDFQTRMLIPIVPVEKEQAKILEAYIINGNLNFNKYNWELLPDGLSTKPLATIDDLNKAIINGKTNLIPKMLNSLACRLDLEDILKCFNETIHINYYIMRAARAWSVGPIIWRELPIKDKRLIELLKVGLEDPDCNVRDYAKQNVRAYLKENNSKLYQYIKARYDLQYTNEPEDHYRQYI